MSRLAAKEYIISWKTHRKRKKKFHVLLRIVWVLYISLGQLEKAANKKIRLASPNIQCSSDIS